MKKKAMFLVGQNQYGVISEMVRRIADHLEQEGYEIGRYEFEDLVRYKAEKEQDWEFIFSALGVEFNLFSGADGKRHVAWLVDHPIYHLSRFENYPDKDQVYIGCVDRSHVPYLKERCGFKNSFFLPHIGWECEKQIPYAERSIDVFFPASYSSVQKLIEENAGWMEGAVKIIVERVISYMQEQDTVTMEQAIEDVLRRLGEPEAAAIAAELESKVGWYIDAYLRGLTREGIVRGLLQRGIKLTVCGRNWEEYKKSLPVEMAANLIILSENMPYLEIVEKMADSKMVLNVLPAFKDGSHERVVMATMNGAISVTDESKFLTEVYQDGKEIVFYDRKDMDGLADKIRWILSHEDEATAIAEAGKSVAANNFTVENIRKWIG